jgi:hypothetical protein
MILGDSNILIPVDLAGTSGDTGTVGDLNRFAFVPLSTSPQRPYAFLLITYHPLGLHRQKYVLQHGL